ncbi:MAG: TfoX/Sxy family DNA transformation protein [Albidovulum sp.]
MKRPVSAIRNLGPASDAGYALAGIHSAEELIGLGADVAYLRYLEAGGHAHFIGYYALVMGLQGRPWNDCRGAEKASLRTRFDRLKAQLTNCPDKKARSRMEADFDEIGLRSPGIP